MPYCKLIAVGSLAMFAVIGTYPASANGVDPVLNFKSAVLQPVNACAKSSEDTADTKQQINICADALEAISSLREEYRAKFKYAENQVWADAYTQQKFGFVRIMIAQIEFQASGGVLTQPTCEQFRLAQQHFANIPPIADEKEWFGKSDFDLRNLADTVSAKCAAKTQDTTAE